MWFFIDQYESSLKSDHNVISFPDRQHTIHSGSRVKSEINGETLTNQHKGAFVCTRAFDWLMGRSLLIKCMRPAPSVLGHLDPGDAMAVIPPSSPLQGSKLPPAKC